MPELDISDEATLSGSTGVVLPPSELLGADALQRSVSSASKRPTTHNHDAGEMTPTKITPDPELVFFSENDPEDPKNWSERKKLVLVANICALSFVAVFGSASYAPGEGQVRQMFDASAEVASLGLTVYVLGFAFGPLLCPMSEMYGRRPPYMISWPLLIAVTALSAWVDNLPVILIFRFFTGCFAGCPLNNGTGLISDIYASTPRKLQKTIGLYAFMALSGPVFGSLIGFFIAAHLTNGLWVIRIHWFMAIALWPLVFFLPETHGPTILTKRARKMRKEGKSTNVFATNELQRQHSAMKDIVQKHIGRPFAMLFIEPIVMGAAVWVALSYSIIYFFFEAFPLVFVEQNHFQYQFGGLPFLGITLGMIICVLSTDKLTQMSRHVKLPFIDPPGVVGTPADAPEAGLKVVLISCVLTPVSLFWFAWTSTGDVHWISPAIAGVLFGYSMLGTIFTIYASSASASNTLFRSVVASIFPIIAHPILGGLGTTWGVSLFGFLSLGLLPIPMVFIRYGPALREKSYFAREARRVVAGLRRDYDDGLDDDGGGKDERGVVGVGVARDGVGRRESVDVGGCDGVMKEGLGKVEVEVEAEVKAMVVV